MYNLAKDPKLICLKMGNLFPCSELVKKHRCSIKPLNTGVQVKTVVFW